MNDTIHLNKEYFKKALIYTSSQTGMRQELIEKDYYCSLILAYLFKGTKTKLVFKGGTCISKVYANFYRMSEDLDFSISTPISATRQQRSNLIQPIKQEFENLINHFNCFSWQSKLMGNNESKQYIGTIQYNSAVSFKNRKGTIKIEISLRETLLQNTSMKPAKTLLWDPFRNEVVLALYQVKVLTIEEVYAEKFRAAICRILPAIRDFYDIHYAVNNLSIDWKSDDFMNLLHSKLSIPSNRIIKMDTERKRQLILQIDAELKPVLRQQDFMKFDFEKTFNFVKNLLRL